MSSMENDLIRRLLGRQNPTPLPTAFSSAGISMGKSGRGHMKANNFVAEVVLEPDGFVTFRVDIDPLPDLRVALRRSGDLTGNARFAITDCGWQLAADTRVNGAAHLTNSLQEIQTAFRSALTKRKSRRRRGDRAGVDAAAAIRRTIEESDCSKQQFVKLEHGWEMQPRLEGQTVPVELRIAGDGVQISRRVLPSLPDDPVVDPVAHQALLFNARLRFARLSVVDGKLIAETRLRTGLIDASWLDFAARAVASAAKGVTPTMELLCEPGVAEHYTELLMNDC
jgi:hypothetical protein